MTKMSKLKRTKNTPSIGPGSQIRTYTMHPYQLVKDERTGEQTTDIDGVLNGNIDRFIEAYLLNDRTKNSNI